MSCYTLCPSPLQIIPSEGRSCACAQISPRRWSWKCVCVCVCSPVWGYSSLPSRGAFLGGDWEVQSDQVLHSSHSHTPSHEVRERATTKVRDTQTHTNAHMNARTIRVLCLLTVGEFIWHHAVRRVDGHSTSGTTEWSKMCKLLQPLEDEHWSEP